MTGDDRDLYWGTPDGGDVHIFDGDVDARSLCRTWFGVTPAIQEPIDTDSPRFSRAQVCPQCYHRVDWGHTDGGDAAQPEKGDGDGR